LESEPNGEWAVFSEELPDRAKAFIEMSILLFPIMIPTRAIDISRNGFGAGSNRSRAHDSLGLEE
jgi:hypothetical protein